MASSSAPLGLELLVPAGVAQLGIVRARSEYGLTDADLQGLPRSAHPGAGVVFSVKDLARVAILKGYRGRGQRVVRITRPDVSRAETLFLPVGIMTTVGEVKAVMPGRADLLGRRPELWLRPEERRAGGPSSAPLHGPAQRLCEFRADGSAQTLVEAGVPNEALLELRRATDREETEVARRAEKVAATSLWAIEIAAEEAKMAREEEKKRARAREQRRAEKKARRQRRELERLQQARETERQQRELARASEPEPGPQRGQKRRARSQGW